MPHCKEGRILSKNSLLGENEHVFQKIAVREAVSSFDVRANEMEEEEEQSTSSTVSCRDFMIEYLRITSAVSIVCTFPGVTVSVKMNRIRNTIA